MSLVLQPGRPAGETPVRSPLWLLRVAAAPVRAVRMPGLADVVILGVRVGIGVALLGVGWFEASGKLTLRAQTPWLTLAIAGTALTLIALVGWVLRLRRAVAARVASVIGRLPILPSPISIAAGGRMVCVAGSETRLYHRPECPLMVGRQAVAASSEDHRLQRRIPCEVCDP